MHDPVITQSADTPVEAALRAELSRSDLTLAAISPVLRHLLTNHDHSLFSDEILSRVRGMIGSLARAMLTAQGETNGRPDPNGIDEADHEALTVAMLAHDGLVGHCHALAVEWQITARLEARHAVDPVLSPLLQALVASDDGATAATAMAALAAQARFAQRQRRMELPLAELPADLFVGVLAVWAEQGDLEAGGRDLAIAALRADYDESAGRLGLMARLVHGMGPGALAALSVSHAGVALFLSALADAAKFGRDLAAIATNEGQRIRLALALSAAALKPRAIEEQFVFFHPDAALPQGLEAMTADRAAELLAASPGSRAL